MGQTIFSRMSDSIAAIDRLTQRIEGLQLQQHLLLRELQLKLLDDDHPQTKPSDESLETHDIEPARVMQATQFETTTGVRTFGNDVFDALVRLSDSNSSPTDLRSRYQVLAELYALNGEPEQKPEHIKR